MLEIEIELVKSLLPTCRCSDGLPCHFFAFPHPRSAVGLIGWWNPIHYNKATAGWSISHNLIPIEFDDLIKGLHDPEFRQKHGIPPMEATDAGN